MQLYLCANCGNRLYFENVACTRCGASLGFLPTTMRLTTLAPTGDGAWRSIPDNRVLRQCTNYSAHAVCNWMVENDDPHAFCVACRLNQTIPDLGVQGNLELWKTMETEKRRLVYSLLRLGLAVVPRSEDAFGLAFDFLADTGPSFSERGRVLTGHHEGLITINIAEADPTQRERMRERMDEPYRTILGHFRHESGHFYWDRLIRNSGWLSDFRALFGDDTRDYAQALDWHYHNGPPSDWSTYYVSAYASSHPWEDWAETWAHYLHILDTLETAYQYGLHIQPRTGDAPQTEHDFDPYDQPDFKALIEHWLPLTFALNSLNRSMGHPNAYPFVLSPMAIHKLDFVHNVVRGAR